MQNGFSFNDRKSGSEDEGTRSPKEGEISSDCNINEEPEGGMIRQSEMRHNIGVNLEDNIVKGLKTVVRPE